MEVSLNLLNKYVKIDDQDPKELADKITSIGLEVEGMHSLANGNNMTIGYVKECIDHPDSDSFTCMSSRSKTGRSDSNCLWSTKCGCWTKSYCG